MATKPEAAKPEAGESEAGESVKGPAKNKKMLLVGGLVFLILALAGGGAWFIQSKKYAAEEGDIEEVAHVAPKGPPTYMPLDNMVINLADPGGEKVAQIGITLELLDAQATDKIKMYLPSIRSGILLLISQRTAEELLMIEGKEKLAADILLEAARPFESAEDIAKAKKKKVDKHATNDNPVQGVLFSSFIVQ